MISQPVDLALPLLFRPSSLWYHPMGRRRCGGFLVFFLQNGQNLRVMMKMIEILTNGFLWKYYNEIHPVVKMKYIL